MLRYLGLDTWRRNLRVDSLAYRSASSGKACEISRVLSECDPLANRIDLSLLEHVSTVERDNVVLYGQYMFDRKLVRRRRRAKRLSLAHKLHGSL
jgi:hypothetical protein